MKIKILVITLLSLLCFSASFVTQINKDKIFWIYGHYNNADLGQVSFNLCFSGVSNKTRTLLLKDSKVDIGPIISSSISISDGVNSPKITSIEKVNYDTVNKQYVLESAYFRGLYVDQVYCLILQSSNVQNLNTIKNLSIVGASSDDVHAVVYHQVTYFSGIDLFSLTGNPAVSAIIDANSFNVADLYETTQFDITVTFAVKMPSPRVIPTLDGQAILYLEFPNINIQSVVIESVNSTNTKTGLALKKIPDFQLNGSTIILSNLGEDLVDGRYFALKFKRLFPVGYSSDVLSLATKVIWRNTNSVVSSHVLSLGKSIARYALGNLSFKHVNNFPLVYPGSSWPMQLTFSVNTEVSGVDVVLSESSSNFQFLISTCDFSLNSNSNSYCVANSSSNITIKNVSAVTNEIFTLRIWVYIATTTSNLSIIMTDVTNSSGISSGFAIKDSRDYNYSDFVGGAKLNFCSGRDSDSLPGGCDSPLIKNENSGNFVLVNGQTNGQFTFDPSKTTFQSLPNVINQNFRMRFRNQIPTSGNLHNQNLSQSFMGDWNTALPDSGATLDDTYFSYGSHSIYLPKDYLFDNNNNNCILTWGSSASVTTNTPITGGYAPQDYTGIVNKSNPTDNSAPFQNNKYWNTIVPAANNNVISFNNYVIDNTTVKLNVGFFHNLIRAVQCQTSPTLYGCNNNLNARNTISGAVDFELATNCVTYNPKMSFTSEFLSYDILHTFQLKTNGNFVRANRYVSLLPQPGIFELTGTFADPKFSIYNQQHILTNYYFQGGYNKEGICLVTITINNNTLIPGREVSNLYIFLNNFSLINFDDMNHYPVGNIANVEAYSNVFVGNKTNKSQFTVLQKFALDPTDVNGVSYFNNSDYTTYVGNYMILNVNSSMFTSNERIIPVKCNVSTANEKFINDSTSRQIPFAFTEIGNTTTNNLGFYQYYAYDNIIPAKRNSYIVSGKVYVNHPNRIITTSAQWNSFVYDNNTQLTFTQTSPSDGYNDLDSNLTYVALASKTNFSIQNYLLDYSKNIIDSSKYNDLVVTNNSFTLNGVAFPYLMIKYLNYIPGTATRFTFGFGNPTYRVSFEGVPMQINPHGPAQINDIALFVGGPSASDINDDFMVTNYNSTNGYFAVVDTTPNNIVNEVAIIQQISYVSGIIKGGDGGKSLCGFVEINIPNYVYHFTISSGNFVARTIAEIKGQGVTYTPNNGVFTFNVGLANTSYSIYFCNISVSQSSAFAIQNVTFFFKDNSTTYYIYDFNNKIVSQTIPSDVVYGAGHVDSYYYDNTKVTYNKLNLHVVLDNDVFRNMILTIEGVDLSAFVIDVNYTPACLPLFNNDVNHPFNVLFKSCFVDFPNKKIVVTTFNEIIIYETIMSDFWIQIKHVNNVNINTYTWTVRARFNEINNTQLFPETSLPVTKLTTYDPTIVQPYDVSSLISFNTILPTLPNVSGLIQFTIDFTGILTSDLTTYFNNNKFNINELRIVLNPSYFGPVPTNLKCYIAGSLVENCTSMEDVIFLRQSISLSSKFDVGLYGYTIFDYTKIIKEKAFILVNFDYRQTFSRDTWLKGKVTLNQNFDASKFANPSVNVANLRIIEQTFDDQNPRTEKIGVQFKVDYDNLGGINPQAIFSQNIQNTVLYISTPEDITFNGIPTIEISAFVYNAGDSTTAPSINEVIYEIDNANFMSFGRLAYVPITTSHVITTQFRYWIIKLGNINTSNDTSRIGVFNIRMVNDFFYCETYPFLITSVGDDALIPNYYFVDHYRGLTLDYTPDKYYFSLNYDSNLKPGVYAKITVNVNGSGLKNAFTSISIAASTNSITSFIEKDSIINLDGRFNLKGTLYAGINCGGQPGKYIVTINSNNTIDFHNVPKAIFNVLILPAQNKITFFSSPNIEYNNNTDVITLGTGGFVYFWTAPLDINTEEIKINFTPRSNTNTTIPPPSSITIPPKTSQPYLAIYSAYVASSRGQISTIQTYDITVVSNPCFTTKIDFISFQPNILVEQFSDTQVTLTDFIYQNAVYQPVETRPLDYSSIRFLVNSNRNSVLPVPSNLYCALYCSERDAVSDDDLRNIMNQKNDWFLSFQFYQIKSPEGFSLTFDNLVRDVDYTLQCLLESSSADPTVPRSSISNTFTQLQGYNLRAIDTPLIECLDLEVQNYLNDNFEAIANNIIQESFYDNFSDRGEILSIDSKGNYIRGYGTNNFDCADTLNETGIDANNTVVNPKPNNSTNLNPNATENASASASASASTSQSAVTVQTNALRYLQTNNTTNSTTTTNTTTNTTTPTTPTTIVQIYQENTDPEFVPNVATAQVYKTKKYYRICLAQSRKSPTVFGVTQLANLQSSLNTLFTDKTARILQPNTTAIIPPSRLTDIQKSPFRKQLTNTMSDNFVGVTYVPISSNYNFAAQNITLKYQSDFQIIPETNMRVTNITFSINSYQDREVHCWFAINNNTNPETSYDTRFLTRCDPSANILCGPSFGVTLPYAFTHSFDLSVFNQKDYALWLTCRQNAIISRSYQAPYLALPITNYYFVGKSAEITNYVYECKLGHADFPGCCNTRLADELNTAVCKSSIITASLAFLLALLLLLI